MACVWCPSCPASTLTSWPDRWRNQLTYMWPMWPTTKLFWALACRTGTQWVYNLSGAINAAHYSISFIHISHVRCNGWGNMMDPGVSRLNRGQWQCSAKHPPTCSVIPLDQQTLHLHSRHHQNYTHYLTLTPKIQTLTPLPNCKLLNQYIYNVLGGKLLLQFEKVHFKI